MPVNVGRPDYQATLPKWERNRDACEGSDAVKARGGGKAYLPPLESHQTVPAKYADYLLRALYYNASGRTVEGLAGAVFQKPPTVTIEEKLEADLQDVTLTGTTAETFCLTATQEVLTVGRYGVLVDYSDARKRPYWAQYRAESVVNWRTSMIGGDQVLTLVVLCEQVDEVDPKDAFTPKSVEQYRVLELTSAGYTQTVYRKAGEGPDAKWAPYAEAPGKDPVRVPMRRGEPLNFIPFVFGGPTSNSPEIEQPPLDDLVQVNLAHYRNSADLEHGLHFVGVPQLVISGHDDTETKLKFGSGQAMMLAAGAKAEILQANGELLGALERATEVKRKLMATLGARLLEEQPTSAETMGAVGMRHAGEHATLRTVAGAIEQAMTWVLQVHSWWMGTAEEPADTGAKVELNKDYFQLKASPEVVRTALLALQAEKISNATFWHVLRTGDWAREGVTVEQEMAEILRESGGGPEPPEPGGQAT